MEKRQLYKAIVSDVRNTLPVRILSIIPLEGSEFRIEVFFSRSLTAEERTEFERICSSLRKEFPDFVLHFVDRC